MSATAVAPYPRGKWLMLAGIMGLLGQLTGLAFMLSPGPYTTIFFVGGGIFLIILAIAVFGVVIYLDTKDRTESISEKSFTAGEMIFRQGDPGDKVFIIKSGEVEIVREDPEKGETILARLNDGDYFGEMALLSDAPRNASARAATKLVTLTIDRYDFQTLFAGVPSFRASIDAAVKQRG